MKKLKRVMALGSIASLGILLSACSNAPLTSHSSGFWDGIVLLNFSRAIIWLSNVFGHSYGLGIIAFTVIVRIVILPLMIFQTRSMKKTQEIQPQLKALQKKYSSRDTETMQKLRAEQQKLYSEAGVNPIAGCLPLVVQLPVLWALYQAILRTQALKTGNFLWLQLGAKDPYLVLPILAAIFTFISSWLSMKSQPESNGMTTSMTYVMPVVIFFAGLNFPAALTLYWVATNAFQALQTLILQNPWKIKREREEKNRLARQKQNRIDKAVRKAKRSRHKK